MIVNEENDDQMASEPYDRGIAETRRMIDDPLTYAIIGAAQKVHGALGPGFVESTYQKALAKELVNRAIPFAAQPEYEVYYEGTCCGTYRPDMVVCEKVVIELKAVSRLAREHIAQAISYLKASGLGLALLLNFGAPSLQCRRLENRKKTNPPNPRIP